MIIEFDVDGVIYDMAKALGKEADKLRDIGEPLNYDYSDFDEDIRSEIFSQFKNGDLFGKYDCLFPDVIPLLTVLSLHLNKVCGERWKIVFHTYVKPTRGIANRLKLINRVIDEVTSATELGSMHYECIVDGGKSKTHIESDIIIEDNIEFLSHVDELSKVMVVPCRRYVPNDYLRVQRKLPDIRKACMNKNIRFGQSTCHLLSLIIQEVNKKVGYVGEN